MTETVRALVPMAFVRSVPASVAFYEHLGFAVDDTFTPDGATEPSWAYLISDGAQLMLAKASHPVVPDQQAVLFYAYCEKVSAMREHLIARGVTAGPVAFPFYAPNGEFRVVDPDGYVVMVTHT